ncbi:unnamed protein product [Prunus armeniaca]|uniref:Uncharacterized protein n=1 Tax=Prunus armeniaca TaxID=36596 RepID=A0A6J5VDJ4_PRUAR|nr:unnamed protein product [Prunus armeniaca]
MKLVLSGGSYHGFKLRLSTRCRWVVMQKQHFASLQLMQPTGSIGVVLQLAVHLPLMEGPMHEHNCKPKNSREDPGKVSEYQQEGEMMKILQSSHGYYKHDDCIKHDKHADEKIKIIRSYLLVLVGSQEVKRLFKKFGQYSRDKYDGSGYRNKDKDRESSFPENQKYKDKDSSSQRVGSGRRHGHFEEMERERDRHVLDRDVQDEKKDYRRNSGDYISERIFSYEESRGQRSDSIPGEMKVNIA